MQYLYTYPSTILYVCSITSASKQATNAREKKLYASSIAVLLAKRIGFVIDIVERRGVAVPRHEKEPEHLKEIAKQ